MPGCNIKSISNYEGGFAIRLRNERGTNSIACENSVCREAEAGQGKGKGMPLILLTIEIAKPPKFRFCFNPLSDHININILPLL